MSFIIIFGTLSFACRSTFVGRSFYVAGDCSVDVGLTLDGWSSIAFQVKAAADARVALTAERHENFTHESTYEISLQLNGAVIR